MGQVFKGHAQAYKSGLITQMWEMEPNKAVWAIMAKAYSNLRDGAGRGRINLEGFLRQVAPYVGVTPANLYLNAMGWELVTPKDGKPFIAATADSEIMARRNTLTTNLSDADITDYCFAMGLVPRPANHQPQHQQRVGLSFTTSVQPAQGSPEVSRTESEGKVIENGECQKNETSSNTAAQGDTMSETYEAANHRVSPCNLPFLTCQADTSLR